MHFPNCKHAMWTQWTLSLSFSSFFSLQICIFSTVVGKNAGYHSYFLSIYIVIWCCWHFFLILRRYIFFYSSLFLFVCWLFFGVSDDSTYNECLNEMRKVRCGRLLCTTKFIVSSDQKWISICNRTKWSLIYFSYEFRLQLSLSLSHSLLSEWFGEQESQWYLVCGVFGIFCVWK